jgi:hypothetical protein
MRYSATMITKSCVTGDAMAAGGSFGSLDIDGRLTSENAIEVARKYFTVESKFKKCEYLGFAIEKTDRWLDYKNPTMIDTNLQAKEVQFLL